MAGTATNISRYFRGIEPRSSRCCAFTAGSREICSFLLRQFDPTAEIALWSWWTRASARYFDACESRYDDVETVTNAILLSLLLPAFGSICFSVLCGYIYIPRPRPIDSTVCFSKSVLSRRHSSFHVSM